MVNKTITSVAIIVIIVTISISGYLFLSGDDNDSNGEYLLSVQGIKESHQLPSNNIPSKPEDPYLEGYIFAGWYLNEERTEPYSFDTPIEPGTIVYAFFIIQEKESIAIQYESCGGTAVSSRIITSGDSFPMEYPSREGYLFVGWYLTEGLAAEADSNKIMDIEKPIYSSIRVYAGWTIDQSKWTKVVFDLGSRHENMTADVMDGKTIAFPPIPSDDAMSFDGWYVDPDHNDEWDPSTEIFKKNHPSGTIQIYAKWISKAFSEYNPIIHKMDGPTYLFEYTDYESGTVNHVYYIGFVEDMILSPIWDFQQNIPSLEVENGSVTISKETIENCTEKTITHSTKTTYEPVGSSNVLKNCAEVISSIGSTVGKSSPKVSAALAGASGFLGILGSFFNEEKVTTEKYEETMEKYYNICTTTYEHHVESSMKASFETVEYGRYIGYMLTSDVEFLQIESFDLEGNKLSSTIEYNIIDIPESKWFVVDDANVFVELLEAFSLSDQNIMEDNEEYLQALADKGIGTADDPILITSKEQFNGMDWTEGCHYKMVTNLDLRTDNISLADIPVFSGHLDGCGHIIFNRSFDVYSGYFLVLTFGIGLFSIITEESLIDNINLIGGTVQSNNLTLGVTNIGSLAGINDGTITNVNVSSFSATSVGSSWTFGGIVGINNGTMIGVKAYNIHSNMTGPGSSNGGIVGCNNGRIENGTSTNVVLSGKGMIGGCVGTNYNEMDRCSVIGLKWGYTKLTFESETTSYEGCGGVVGYNYGKLWYPTADNVQIVKKGNCANRTGEIVGSNNGGFLVNPMANGHGYEKPSKKLNADFSDKNYTWIIDFIHTGRSTNSNELILE